MKQKSNGSKLDESTVLLQQAMASLMHTHALFLQNQTTLSGRIDTLGGRMDTLGGRIDSVTERIDRLEEKMDRKFSEVDHRLEHIESLLAKMFAELPEKVFGFAQAAAKKQSS